VLCWTPGSGGDNHRSHRGAFESCPAHTFGASDVRVDPKLASSPLALGPSGKGLPTTGVNPVLIDPTTGDLGGGSDCAIGGEATADASALPGEGDFTFGIVSAASGSFDITVFVEEPGGPNDNDDPDEGEPQDTASLIVGSGGGGGGGGSNVSSTITISGSFEGKGSIVGCRLRARPQGRGEAGQEGARSSGWSRRHRPVGHLSRLRPEPERSFLCHRDEEGRRCERRRQLSEGAVHEGEAIVGSGMC